ncbi:putative amino-acid metabolite efflux pump [Desulfosporosinus acididurans]|uniref:Putative amino-acid metabolite efflux pump n=1 Tax=Desulfosporosinus acididurans TaxID=476652 RepID=A0A0J1FN23_9FIRM|nr:DMT family transporter [Desulfosporosinus acididurans]KLU64875.1 putative amino-acid metabolite efflux pump [Desulfosporosinus acididurans]
MENHKLVAGHLSALGTILIWGVTFISTKLLLKDFTPIEILLFRFIIGYIALFLVYPHRLKTKDFKEELLFALSGLCGVTLYFLLENIALTFTLAANVGIIVSIAPLFTALLAYFFEGENLRTEFFIGFIVAIIGIVLVMLNGSYFLRVNPLGDILASLAAIVWAVYSVLMRRISRFHYNTIGCTRKVFFYGLLFMIPALFFVPFHFDYYAFTKVQNMFNLLFLGLGASAVCFVSWNWSVSILGAVKTSVYIYIVPVITIAASALILHEIITWVAFVGVLLTLAGLYVSERKTVKIVKQIDV